MRWPAAVCLLLLAAAAGAQTEPAVQLRSRPLTGLRADIATLILAGREGGSIRATAAVAPVAEADGRTAVALWIEIEGSSLLGGEPPESLKVEIYAYVLTKAGAVKGYLSQSLRLDLEELGEILFAGGVKFFGRIEASGLDAEYDVRVLIREPRSQRLALRVVPGNAPPLPAPVPADPPESWIEVRQAGLGEEWKAAELAWTGLRPQAPEPAPERRTQTLDLAERRTAQRVRAIAAAYREVLRGLDSGLDTALAELRKMEDEVFESAENEARQLLNDGESRMIAELLREHDVEILIPLLVLHMDLHDRYVRERRFPAAAHSRDLVVAFARRYAEEADNELAPVLAAEALAAMGAYLHRAQLRVPGRSMLEEALKLDASNSFALLNLAAAHELAAEYPEAISYLERLVAVEPRSGEGRLRLAVGLRRTGRLGDAARWLRRLIDDGAAGWHLALAYQELGRIYCSQERFDAAVEVLEQGLVRLPTQRRLYVQLAYALDRSGEGRRGHEVLERAPETPPEGWLSPRFLYNRRSDNGRAATRQSLRRGGMARLPVLLQALESAGSGP